MSAIPVLRPDVTTFPTRTKERAPVQQPKARPSAKARAKARARVKARVITFAFVASCAFLVNGLSGNVMVEKARREGIDAAQRTRQARVMQATLQRQTSSITSLNATEEWALASGFVAADRPVGSSSENSRVAFNR